MASGADRAAEVARLVSDNDVRFIRLWFTDILGSLKSFSINAEFINGNSVTNLLSSSTFNYTVSPRR